MAYNEILAQRTRAQLAGQAGISERKMFGGIAWFTNGNLCCGVHKDALIVRVAPQDYLPDLRRPHTRVFDITGREMKGWLLVDPDGLTTPAELKDWVDEGVAFASSLPPKVK